MRKVCLSLIIASVLVGCGGGGSSSASFTPTPTPSPSPTPAPTPTPTPSATWQQGIFEPASDFKDRCEVVRSNLDIDGNPYPDVQGSELQEKLWLRSWSDETYLWFDEIIDRDPDGFSSPQSYFEVLVTEQTTPSGARKDNFHFQQSTEEYESFAQSGTQTGYGIDWAFLASAPPRDIRVATVDPGSSAALAGVQRGDKLISIDNANAVSGNNVDFLNNALFPSAENSLYDFTFRRVDGSEVVFTLTSGNYAKSFVNNVRVLDTDAGKVGYLRFDGFQRPAQSPLISGFQQFVDDNVTDLVLDLRYNGGGLLAMSSQLGYMIAGPGQTDGRTFETLQFNSKNPTTNPVTGQSLSPTPFYTQEIDWERGVLTNNSLPTLNLSRVFIITTNDTCSASEALINGLRGIDVEVIQIGGTTCGKPYGFYPTDNCGTTYFTIQFQGVNDKGFGEFAEGFRPRTSPVFDDEVPGCRTTDDFNSLLGDSNEGMLSTALERLTTGECPAGTDSVATQSIAEKMLAEEQSGYSVFDARYRSILLDSRILTDVKVATDD